MTAKKEGRVTIEMSEEEHDRLICMMGYAVGAAMRQDSDLGWGWIRLVNRLNEGNPDFVPYKIPDRGEKQ